MIFGIGIDIAENRRFEALQEGFKRKIYTDYEISEGESRERKSEYYASRFAAKEAVSKALKSGFGKVSAKNIEIKEGSNGEPYATISGVSDITVHISISHERDYSAAIALIEK